MKREVLPVKVIKKRATKETFSPVDAEFLKTAKFSQEWIRRNVDFATNAAKQTENILGHFDRERYKKVVKAFLSIDPRVEKKLERIETEKKRERVLELLARALLAEAFRKNDVRPWE